MKNHPSMFASLAALLLLPLASPVQAEHTGGAPYERGILCLDGANRGANLIGQLRELRGTQKGDLIHQSPRLGYYSAYHCVKMNEIGIPVGKKMVGWLKYGDYGRDDLSVCNGRNVIENDGSDKVVWLQLRGSTEWHRYCETKRALHEGPLK